MPSLLIGLLLAGVEPSTYGFLNHGISPSLHGDSPRGHANNVVVHHASDSTDNTMHIHEVPTTCMGHPAARRPNVPELTSVPLAQRDLVVQPRGPINPRDVHKNTAGFDYNNHSARDPLNLWWVLQQVTEEYQYFVRKPPSPPRSRRRRRYEERISWLSGRSGRAKKRRKLGPPGTDHPNHTETRLEEQKAPKSPFAAVAKWVVISYVPCLTVITTCLYLDMLATHASMGTDVIKATTFAFLVSMLVMLFATRWLFSTLLAFVWSVPLLAAIFVCLLDYLLAWGEYWYNVMRFWLLCLCNRPRIHVPVSIFAPRIVVCLAEALAVMLGVPSWDNWGWYSVRDAAALLSVYAVYAYLLNRQLFRQTCIWMIARRCIYDALRFAAALAVAAVSPSVALPAACRATRRLTRYAWLFARYTCRWLGLGRTPLAQRGGRFGPGTSWLIIMFGLLRCTIGMEGDQGQGTKVKPPMFSGERSEYTQWMIQFTVWVALYLQECASLLEGNDPEPTTEEQLLAANPATPEVDLSAARSTHVRWTARNRKLFGAIAMAMPKWLMQSLYTSCRNNGLAARLYMQSNFSAVAGNGNDRAAAITRLQRSHIDSRADLSEQDIRAQYDSMMIAVADLQAAGAAAPDEPMLISMFENALPASYTVIRQLVRRQAHDTLLAYYTDMLREVRAELQSRAPTAHAFPAVAAGAPSPAAASPPAPATHDANVAALVAALQAMGSNRFNGGNNVGGKRPREPYPSEPCLICGKEGHKRESCRKAATAAPCRFCGKKGHAPPYCPHNPTAGGKRKALTQSLRALVDKEAGPMPLPNVASGAPGTSASHAPATYAAAVASRSLTEEQAQAHAAAAAAQHADPAAMATAYAAALKACGYGLCATVTTALTAAAPPVHPVVLPPAARASKPDSCHVVTVFVDTMATYFVVNDLAYLVRVTDADPTIGIQTADGIKPVKAVGVAHMWVPDVKGVWQCYEVPNVLLLPKCGQCLYSQRVMRDLFGFQHDFDKTLDIRMPGRPALPMHDSGTSFAIMVAFSTAAVPAARRVTPTGYTTALVACALAAGSVGTPQALLFQRLAYPHAQAWRHVAASTRGHNLPPGVVMSGSLPVHEAVMRGRARALPFLSKPPQDRTPPPPGAVVYMDFAGPVAPSFPHGLTTYCGAIDAGSLYGRIMAAHTMTRDIATQTLSLILADIAAKMQSAVPVKPFVVNCDNGSAFISKHFREFLADRQIALRFSPPYTPQLNAQIESMWCTTFATARVLLASASLPPSLHPFAMQTARWIENRLPKPTRGNQTPVFMLSKQLPDLSHLYTFGCLCLVTLPGPLREGDAHFMDRGAPGLYLGPSEEGQCHIVYVFALRRVLPTAKLRVWEDQFPGLRGHRYTWFPTLPAAGSEGPVPPAVQSSTSSSNNNDPPPHSNSNNAQSPPAEPASSPSPPPSPPLSASLPPPALSQPQVNISDSVDPATEFDPMAATAPDGSSAASNTTKLPKGDSGDPNDPQSRVFNRVMPSRSSRNSNPDYTSLAGRAALAVACSTFNRLNAMIAHSIASPGNTESDPYLAGPVIAFACYALSTDAAFINFDVGGDDNIMTSLEVAATICAASIVSTADYGDIPVPRGYKAAMSGPWASYWRAAIDKELAGLIALRTWDLIPATSVPRGSNLMNCHYVFDVKRLRDATVEKFKARLVADGNTQKYGVDYDRIFATVVKTSTIRLALIIAAARDFNLTQIDIRQAYLQAELPEKLYMRVPPGIPQFNEKREPLVCRLNRTLYGLKQAGREWGVLFASFLVSWGFTRSTIDTCLFTYTQSGQILWMLVYVDDCIIVDNDESLRARFVADLSKRFPVDDRGELTWMLGLAVHRDRSARELTLSQELYIKDLVERYAPYIRAGHNRKYDTPVEEGLRLSHDDCPAPNSEAARQMVTLKPVYMALVGAFLWLGNMVYSEICHVTTQLARFVSNPGLPHFDAATRVLIYLDGKRDQGLRFAPDPSLPLHVYVDSSWETKFSCSGAYYFFMGCHFHWWSKMQRSVSLSSAEAEFFGCMLALKDTLWVRQLLIDLGFFSPGPTSTWCDSKSAVALTLDPVAFKNTKHIMRAAEFLKDHVLRGSVTISHSKGSTMVADILTKGQARPVFLQLLKLLHGYSKRPVASLED